MKKKKIEHGRNIKILDFFQEQGILYPTLDVVEHVNGFILSLVPEDEKEYISYDSVCKQTRIMRQTIWGVTVVSGDDFRQILPVIRKGCRQDILASSINSSKLWSHCNIFTLTTNMRLRASTVRAEQDEIRKFVDWMLSIGDGIGFANESGEINVLIHEELLIKDSSDPLHYRRGILAPTLDAIEHVNKFLLSLVPVDEKEYISFDLVCESDENNEVQSEWFTTELLNSMKFFDISNNKLRFTVGCPVTLIWNIDQATGLCNGTRLIVDNLCKNFIGATLITEKMLVKK
ncbi:PIF1-like helicase [Medicago truncatula]|uniref:ATP-dependent DNA helicase n=1 Tax=Medicago truncatula TaxID=3880 RepID=A0A072TQZ7_MEDTR|nr:PIF1-like helicase [Medicago truncatula]